jgi:hypothetical protein
MHEDQLISKVEDNECSSKRAYKETTEVEKSGLKENSRQNKEERKGTKAYPAWVPFKCPNLSHS